MNFKLKVVKERGQINVMNRNARRSGVRKMRGC